MSATRHKQVMSTDLKERDQHEVRVWRRRRLLESGFSPAIAAELAGDPRYDLHALIELTEKGCSPELAVRIMAPLEEVAA
jgi:hypothetical protein